MNKYFDLLVEPLNKNYDRASFRCGVEALDRYLHQQANQDVKRLISRVFVASIPDNPKKIIGYYTLSSLSIELNELPKNLSRKLPKHQVPAVLLGRLAVSEAAQGHGVGKMLLADAIKRILRVSDTIAVYVMVVDAINQDSQHFYEHFGFSKLSGNRFFLPLKKYIFQRGRP